MILKDKVAMVTGASRGIGAAIAKLLGEEGARIVLNYQKGIGDPNGVLKGIKDSGDDGIAIQADLTKKEEVDSMIRSAISHFAKIDITPLGRLNTTEKVARVVLFFASPWSDAITGSYLPVDGGCALPY